MCTGLAISCSELPASFVEANVDHLYLREGREELQFHWWQSPAMLPVRWGGKIVNVRWGSKLKRSPLPLGGWIEREPLEAGSLAHMEPEEVVIPANLGFQHGTWFLIEEGIAGVLIPETPLGPVAYMLMVPSTNYYRNMTGQTSRMPVFVNQVI